MCVVKRKLYTDGILTVDVDGTYLKTKEDKTKYRYTYIVDGDKEQRTSGWTRTTPFKFKMLNDCVIISQEVKNA